MNENYIVINGKRAELTEEQLKQLGIEVNKRPFGRQPKGQPFFFITCKAKVEYGVEGCDFYYDEFFNVANYCTDKGIMEQRALHEILNRLLWRYSMEHDKSEFDWDNVMQPKFRITYNYNNGELDIVSNSYSRDIAATYFHTKAIAEAAIKEIVEPFMTAHPEFKW